MSRDELLKTYKEQICTKCTAKCCNKGITVFTETINEDNEVKQVLCAKCVDYKRESEICK
ncbi:MAG: hypothetical protein J6A89_04075 [Clostridia bacterium]|nr:hypothetical protein [Clostridia bacterium]